MSNIIFDKFGPRLIGIKQLIKDFDANLYYIYDSKNVLENFKSSTDHLMQTLHGEEGDNEETVFENLGEDIDVVKNYVLEWQEHIDNETYKVAIKLMQNLHAELVSLSVAWDTQTDSEKREALGSMQKQRNIKI